jgi:hypothetical protein
VRPLENESMAHPRSTARIITDLLVGALAFAVFASALGLTPLRAADKPLTRDDVTLLLLGGASPQKMVQLIQERGVSFQVTAELANEFRRDGADDSVIQALESASGKGAPTPPASSSPAGASGVSAAPGSPPTAQSVPAAPASQSSAAPAPASASGPSLIRRTSSASAPVASPPSLQPAGVVPSATSEAPVAATRRAALPAAPAAPAPDLSDPTPERIQQIIQAFAAKETLFKQARDNYTYHQINKVQELGADGEVTGAYEQDWDILYDDNGTRIERVTYAPLDTLKQVGITQEDLDAFRNIQPFVLTTEELPEYDIKYLGHVKVDELTTYVFSIRPKEIKKGQQYFQGVVWVDDRDLQIAKSEGKNVPELRKKGGEENLFPRFTTWREQIDGKFWFPTFTLADDNLYFSSGPVHLKEVIKYTDYKQFKSSVKIKTIGQVPGVPEQPQPPQNQKNPPKN